MKRLTLIIFFPLFLLTMSAFGQNTSLLDYQLRSMADSLLTNINENLGNKRSINIFFDGVENLNGESSLLEKYIEVNFLHHLIQFSKEKVFFVSPRRDSSKVRRREISISSNRKSDLIMRVVLHPSSNGIQLVVNALENPYLASLKKSISWNRELLHLYRNGSYRTLPIEIAAVIFDPACPSVSASEIEFKAELNNYTRDSIWIEEVSIQFKFADRNDSIPVGFKYAQGNTKEIVIQVQDQESGNLLLANEFFSFKVGKEPTTELAIIPPASVRQLKIKFFQSDEMENFPKEFWKQKDLSIDTIKVRLSNFVEEEEYYGCKLFLARD